MCEVEGVLENFESHRNIGDLEDINILRNSAVTSIRNEMNFFKYYETELKSQDRIEYKCLAENGGLFNLILNVYANYEFAVRRMLIYTLEIIDKNEVGISSINVNLKALAFKDGIEDLRKKITSSNPYTREYISHKLIKIYKEIAEREKFEAKEEMIETKSNLKYETFCEIISYFEFEESNFRAYKPYIDSLVHHRNNVAHGNIGFIDSLPRRMIPIKSDNYETVCEKVIELLNLLYGNIRDYVLCEKYYEEI